MKHLVTAFVVLLVLSLTGCNNQDYSPKPKAFHRIYFPEKEYKALNIDCNYDFEIPTYAIVENDQSNQNNRCWKNIAFPDFNAKIHLSYYNINSHSNFEQLTEDARTFVFKHTTKATAIDQKVINEPNNKVYGLEYTIHGNTASNYQFYLSDSTKHYLRGALYFNEKPHLDSIKPVLEFLKKDIEHLIQTIRWK